ncbi:MAG: hypothetical protein NZM09_01185 [Ignavibacterium sp.]|nr:hypothetical protein [Ignavibacterium sp.]MDW8374285.1 hypothetical protein [Ignavibacteriales bacterium]
MKTIANQIIILLLLLNISFYSQNDSKSCCKKDFSVNEDEDHSCCYKTTDLSDEDEIDLFDRKSKPTISISYGAPNVDSKYFKSINSIKPVNIELKLGTLKQKDYYNSEDIIKSSFNYFLINNYSTYLIRDNNSVSNLKVDIWRFGFGVQSGFGYKINESFAIIPFTENSVTWSHVDFAYDSTIISNFENDYLKLFDKSFRFGISSEGGLKFRLINNLCFDFSFERHIIFQRVLFWKLSGSHLIEFASQSLLDNFIDRIFKSSPNAAPIVSFVLKNALSYGFNQLRTERMNWPFISASPLFIDQFKIGVNFIF